MIDTEQVLKKSEENLKKGRAVATGIGVFAAITTFDEGKTLILLRRREEKESLFGKDLSGNWELPGGGVELVDFKDNNYQGSINRALIREIREETGLVLISNSIKDLNLVPAWLSKDALIDLSFVTLISIEKMEPNSKDFEKNCLENKVRFFLPEEIEHLNIISPRMKFMIIEALKQASRMPI